MPLTVLDGWPFKDVILPNKMNEFLFGFFHNQGENKVSVNSRLTFQGLRSWTDLGTENRLDNKVTAFFLLAYELMAAYSVFLHPVR